MLDWVAWGMGWFGEGVAETFSGLVAWGIGLIADLLITLSAALPSDPFELPQVAEQWETGLAWLNWWLPIGQIVALLAAWAAANIAYITFSWVIRKYAGVG